MNCDDFLPELETGGLVRRMLARCHAARCPRCAAVRAAFTATKQQLALPEPLSPRARRLWERAAGEAALRTPGGRRWIAAAATGLGVAASIGVLLLIVDLAARNRADAPQPPPAVTRPMPEPRNTTTIEEIDPAEELARLAAAVERLDKDLQTLRHEAERLDARQQIAVTLDRFSRW
jgi:hypothetical protein